MRALRALGLPFLGARSARRRLLASVPHSLSQTTGNRDNAAHRLGHTTGPVGVGEVREPRLRRGGLRLDPRRAHSGRAKRQWKEAVPARRGIHPIERLRFSRREELVLAALDIAVPPSCFAEEYRSPHHSLTEERPRALGKMLEQVASVVNPCRAVVHRQDGSARGIQPPTALCEAVIPRFGRRAHHADRDRDRTPGRRPFRKTDAQPRRAMRHDGREAVRCARDVDGDEKVAIGRAPPHILRQLIELHPHRRRRAGVQPSRVRSLVRAEMAERSLRIEEGGRGSRHARSLASVPTRLSPSARNCGEFARSPVWGGVDGRFTAAAGR